MMQSSQVDRAMCISLVSKNPFEHMSADAMGLPYDRPACRMPDAVATHRQCYGGRDHPHAAIDALCS